MDDVSFDALETMLENIRYDIISIALPGIIALSRMFDGVEGLLNLGQPEFRTDYSDTHEISFEVALNEFSTIIYDNTYIGKIHVEHD